MYRISFIFILISILFSCKKSEPEIFPIDSNEYVNQWILDSLKRYYYWSESLPKVNNIDQEPKLYFNSLLHERDKFSYIINSKDPNSFPKSYRSMFGFDYSTVTDTHSGITFGLVKYVYKDSPAAQAGLKRGSIIHEINDIPINPNNAKTLLELLIIHPTVNLTIAKLEDDKLIDIGKISLIKGPILDQQILTKTFEVGGKKVGYIFLYDFLPGTTQAIVNAISDFKFNAINDLIIDLRYNPGGQVSEAAGLAGLIADIKPTEKFISYKGNKNAITIDETISESAESDGLIDYVSIHAISLKLKKVYILCGNSTASSSEILINNLKPFIDVVCIGEATKGKDMASFSISDLRKEKLIFWEIHPIIYKIYNAKDEGDYSNGLVPNIKINELNELPLKELGSMEDLLLNSAIKEITGYTTKTNILKNDNSTYNWRILTNTHENQMDNESLIIRKR